MRLDLYLVKYKVVETRNIAAQLIVENQVLVNQQIINKKNYLVNENTDRIEVLKALKYVSRGGIKLEHALMTFNIDLSSKIALDVGSSTGGFVDCLLQYQIKKVYALDVGCDQLNPIIKNNKKVIDLSPLNLKNLNDKILPEQVDIITCDISFISCKHLFESLNNLTLKNKTELILLIKPQFELTLSILKKAKHKLTETKYHNKAIENVLAYAKQNNWKNISYCISPIKGVKKQNTEFLAYFIKGDK